MESTFLIDHLDVERLLADWRWLCPEPVTLVARNNFGDLFLLNAAGRVLWLDITLGKLSEVADSVPQFRDLLGRVENRETWLAESHARMAEEQGLEPNANQCIGFATPLIFAESGYGGNAYVADLYDHVGFLGDLHKKVSTLPEGAKVELRAKAPDSEE